MPEYDAKKRLQFRGYLFQKALHVWPTKHSKYKKDPKAGVKWCLDLIDRAYESLVSIDIKGYRQKGGLSIYPDQELTPESKVFMDLFEELVFGNVRSDVNRAETFPDELVTDLLISVKSLWAIANDGNPMLDVNGQTTVTLEELLEKEAPENKEDLARLVLFSLNKARGKNYIPLSSGYQADLLRQAERHGASLALFLESKCEGDFPSEIVTECLASVTALLGWMVDPLSPELPFDKDLFRAHDELGAYSILFNDCQPAFESRWWNRSNEMYQLIAAHASESNADGNASEFGEEIYGWDCIAEAAPQICSAFQYAAIALLSQIPFHVEGGEITLCELLFLSFFANSSFESVLGSARNFVSCLTALTEEFSQSIDELNLTDIMIPLISLAASCCYFAREERYIVWESELEGMLDAISHWSRKYIDGFADIEQDKRRLALNGAACAAALMAWMTSFRETPNQDAIEQKYASIVMLIDPELFWVYGAMGGSLKEPKDFSSTSAMKVIAQFVTTYVKAYKECGTKYGLLWDQILFAAAFNDLRIDIENGRIALPRIADCVNNALKRRFGDERLQSKLNAFPSELRDVINLVFEVLAALLSLDNPQAAEPEVVHRVLEMQEEVIATANERWQANDDLFCQCFGSAEACLQQEHYLSLIRAFSSDF